ncbi:MAG: DUF2796 domain-containing protein [Rubrivivax sp.]
MRAPLITLALVPVLALAAPHQHGVARLTVAVDGARLTVGLESPLDGLLGFERAPRTDAERQAAATLLARLKAADALIRPDPAAACKLVSSQVTAPALQPGAPVSGEHADLDAEFAFDCASPAALRSIDVGLFDAFRRLQRIEVDMAGPRGQARHTLTRPARTLTLPR